MKVAFIISPSTVISGKSNGVRSQAMTWQKGVEKLGVEVDLIGAWDIVDFRAYDVIHVFQTGTWLFQFLEKIQKINDKIVFSPIVDSVTPIILNKVYCRTSFRALNITSVGACLRQACLLSKYVLVRSEYEKKYIALGAGISDSKIEKVPLGISVPSLSETSEKEEFCLHVSSIYQDRKNVKRLALACADIGVKLVLGGSTGPNWKSSEVYETLSKLANIEVLGFLNEEDLEELYNKAKVFALPSLYEGVGLAALEAGIRGCGVIGSSKGGTGEYIGDEGYMVDPRSIKSIRMALTKCFSDPKQPALSGRIRELYSEESSCKQLMDVYLRVAGK